MQAVHGPPSTPVYPALHRHKILASLPAPDLEFASQRVHVAEASAAVSHDQESAAQFVHDADPVVALYFPAAQAVHAPPFPVYPSLHAHAETAPLKEGESAWGSQSALMPDEQ